MNQILSTKIKNKLKKSKQFVIQFTISLIAIVVVFIMYLYYKINQEKEKMLSDSISSDYEIYRLYATQLNQTNNSHNPQDIIGTISIPKLNISYPFFYDVSEELLKVSPCRFAGEMPPKKSNLCIAGHNYNDDRFFSKVFNLDYGDLIQIEDNNKNSFSYYVYDNFEISESSLFSAINHNVNSNSEELTLVTCNNFNDKRIIIKAKTESLQ